MESIVETKSDVNGVESLILINPPKVETLSYRDNCVLPKYDQLYIR